MTTPAPSYTVQAPDEMTYEEYLLLQAAITAVLVAQVGQLAVPYMAPAISQRAWLNFLASAYPYVRRARRRSAELARRYYDAERARIIGPERVQGFSGDLFNPSGPRIRVEDSSNIIRQVFEVVEIDLEDYYEPNWFEDDMRPARKELVQERTTDNQLAKVIGFAQKQAENAGRKTVIRAVDNDPKTVGWARVEGNENIGSCGFCAMLISRGPVYSQAEDAGLDLYDNSEAVEVYRQAEETGNDAQLKSLMTRWHPNCDCKVVPVFDRANWQGRDQYMAMSRLWTEATRGVHGQDALNAFRRAIERGETGEALRPRLRSVA